MTHKQKAWLVALALGLGWLGLKIGTSWTQGSVYCVNCGTEWTQLHNKLQMAQQLETALKQLDSQLQQYRLLAQNSQRLTQGAWGHAWQDLQSVQQLLRNGRSLAWNAHGLGEAFDLRYRQFRQYSQQRLQGTDWARQYAQWSEDSLAQTRSTLRAIGAQNAQLGGEETVLQQLETLSQEAGGQMQALQVGHQMAAQGVRQLQKLRQLMMMQLQMQADFIASQQNQAAAQDAARQYFFQKRGHIPVDDGKRY